MQQPAEKSKAVLPEKQSVAAYGLARGHSLTRLGTGMARGGESRRPLWSSLLGGNARRTATTKFARLGRDAPVSENTKSPAQTRLASGAVGGSPTLMRLTANQNSDGFSAAYLASRPQNLLRAK